MHVLCVSSRAAAAGGWAEGHCEAKQRTEGQSTGPWGSWLTMDDTSSLGKVSGSTESVATVTSEEFVLVQPSAGGSPSGSEGKPRLKVGLRHNTHTLIYSFDQSHRKNMHAHTCNYNKLITSIDYSYIINCSTRKQLSLLKARLVHTLFLFNCYLTFI